MIARNGFRTLGACFTAVALGLVACGGASETVASKYVKTATIGSAGGTITVAAADDATLTGTSITIPANALKTDTPISIGISVETVFNKAASGSTAAGPVIDFEPSGTVFAVPVTITLPVTLASGVDASRLFVEAVEANGDAKSLKADYANGIATIQASGFTDFGGCISSSTSTSGTCATDADCAAGEVCDGGRCSPTEEDAGIDAGETDGGSGAQDATADVSPGGLCSTDADCFSGEVCEDGRCTTESGDDSGVDSGAADGAIDGGSGAQDATTDAVACASGQTDCSGTCIDLTSDTDNCGACGVECPSGDSCVEGRCQ